jgi:hypothetical protein
VKSVKLAKHEFYRLYCDLYTRFDDSTFDDFNAIQALINDAFPMNWFSDFNGGEDVCLFGILICWTQVHCILTQPIWCWKASAYHEGIFQAGCGQSETIV